jgi:hypothetical protein
MYHLDHETERMQAVFAMVTQYGCPRQPLCRQNGENIVVHLKNFGSIKGRHNEK